MLVASWHRFKGLEADAIETIEMPDREEGEGAGESVCGAVAGEALAYCD